MQSSVDRSLLDMAAEGDRILLTEDKDFGWLVYVGSAQSAGVILIRYPGDAGEYTIGVFRISPVAPDEVAPTVFQLKGSTTAD